MTIVGMMPKATEVAHWVLLNRNVESNQPELTPENRSKDG
jgi:hypothetical protein